MEQLSLWGTIVNTFAVIIGSGSVLIIKTLFGKAIEKSKKSGKKNAFVDKLSYLADPIMKALALSVLMVGITGAVHGSGNDSKSNTLIVIISMVLGTAIGTFLNLDGGIDKLGKWIEDKTKGKFGNVAEGFVSASLLFCIGAMTILGALDSGLRHDHTTLYTKSILDLCSSAVFAATMGIGVTFSAAFVFLYQGLITVCAGWIAPLLSDVVINEMTVVGSLLIIALSTNILGLTKIKTMNCLPAVFFPILLCSFM